MNIIQNSRKLVRIKFSGLVRPHTYILEILVDFDLEVLYGIMIVIIMYIFVYLYMEEISAVFYFVSMKVPLIRPYP